METKGWDVFRVLPPETDSSSEQLQKWLIHAVKILKVLAYLFTFCMVLVCGVVTKVSLNNLSHSMYRTLLKNATLTTTLHQEPFQSKALKPELMSCTRSCKFDCCLLWNYPQYKPSLLINPLIEAFFCNVLYLISHLLPIQSYRRLILSLLSLKVVTIRVSDWSVLKSLGGTLVLTYVESGMQRNK